MSNESIADAASTVTYTGAALAAGSSAPHLVFGLSMDQWTVFGIIFGMAMAAGGLLVNFYFRKKHFELAERMGGDGGTLGDGD